MTVTMRSADQALKTAYLDVVSEYLDYKTNPFLAKIKKTSENVWGKEIKKLVKVGIHGGVGAGTEDGDLPTASGSKYAEFVIKLKNLYGTIEITDKAIRASENKSGAFTNLLNDEINSLISAANFNFSRMLLGDGTGKLSGITYHESSCFKPDNINCYVEGMKIQFYDPLNERKFGDTVFTVTKVDRVEKLVYFTNSVDVDNFALCTYVTGVNAYGNELTGLMSLFDPNIDMVYGVNKDSYPGLFPQKTDNVGEISETKIQAEIDKIEDSFGGKINFILCSSGVKRALMSHLSTYKRNIDTMDLQGGYKTISFNGIPVVSDRFCPPGHMFLLNTDDFAIHQLCDWQWIEGEDGRILRQLENKPVYRATLVKYAELLCSRPWAQGLLTGINEA
ncbi:MAG: phage major capsid protein [Clostridia bacterium]|nr:phage major capsid protein [Clostridia bacterium]